MLLHALLLLASLQSFNAQTLSGCGTEYGCYPAPTGCVNLATHSATKCEFIYKFKINPNNSEIVEFVLSAKVKDPKNAWIAVGFGYKSSMVNSSNVICKSNSSAGLNTAEPYYTYSHKGVTIVDADHRSIGLEDVSITITDSLFTCTFSRMKSLNDSLKDKFFDIGQKNVFYMLAAKGELKSNGEPMRHYTVAPSIMTVDFSSKETVTTAVSHLMAKIHGILMIVGWVLFASIGILLPRYMKFLYPERQFFGVDFWFFAHRLLMICVPLCSISGLIIMLIHKDWTWVSKLKTKNFIHSITGILAISFAVIQVLGGATRPAKDAPNRKVFNWAHRLSGVTTLLLSVVAMCLGFNFFLPGHSWTLSLLWVVWIVVVPCFFEVIDRSSNTEKVVNNEMGGNGHVNKRKKIIFAVHLIVQIAITVAFIVRIVIA